MEARHCTVKVLNLPRDTTKEDVKTHFKDVTGCAAPPSVVIDKPGFAVVLFHELEDAQKALESEQQFKGVTISVVRMPPMYLDEGTVGMCLEWVDTFSKREDIREKLKKEHDISSLHHEGKWTFTGNFYKLQNLHRLLDDMMPLLDAGNVDEEFIVVSATSEHSDKDSVNGDEQQLVDQVLMGSSAAKNEESTCSSAARDFDMISDDLYTEEQPAPDADRPTGAEGNQAVANPSSHVKQLDNAAAANVETLEQSGGNDVIADELQTPPNVEETKVVAASKIPRSMSPQGSIKNDELPRHNSLTRPLEQTSEHARKTEDVQQQTFVVVTQNKSLPNKHQSSVTHSQTSTAAATVGSAAATGATRDTPHITEVFLNVASGVFQFIKDKRSRDLKQISETCNVIIKRTSAEGKYETKVKIAQKDTSKASFLQEALKRLEFICREVNLDVRQLAYPMDSSPASSGRMDRLLKEIVNEFPDITLCRKDNEVLLVGKNGVVQRAGDRFQEGYNSILTNRPRDSRQNPSLEDNVARVNGQEHGKTSESEDLINQLLSRGEATPSVMNDIFSLKNVAVQRLPQEPPQLESEIGFPRLDEEYIPVAEPANAAAAPVVSAGRPDEHPQTKPACSFCCEADETTLAKLHNCAHYLCVNCMEQAMPQGFCPVCEEALVSSTFPTGAQPKGGKMTEEADPEKLPGFENNSKGTIIITYDIPDGVQTQLDPKPGQPYKGSKKRAYLPDTTKGREVLRMLRVAFRHRLLFTIENDHAVWASGITHKTEARVNKVFGYPDATYLDRVTEELASFGITMEYVRQQYQSPPNSLA